MCILALILPETIIPDSHEVRRTLRKRPYYVDETDWNNPAVYTLIDAYLDICNANGYPFFFPCGVELGQEGNLLGLK